MIICKSESELRLMREAGEIVAQTHRLMKQAIKPGITTAELDKIAEQYIRSRGATPSFKGYHGFPASICASVNEQVVHGFPNQRRLVEGDIISIDIGANFKGYHGDSAWTYPVGQISEDAQRLLDVTERSLYEGILFVKPGNHLTQVSGAIQNYVELNGMSIVREYVGHGIGSSLHEDPQIPNYVETRQGKGPKLKKGMVLAIEPMVNLGVRHVRTLTDNWTVVTTDGAYSAHFEHTVAITETGFEILTRCQDDPLPELLSSYVLNVD